MYPAAINQKCGRPSVRQVTCIRCSPVEKSPSILSRQSSRGLGLRAFYSSVQRQVLLSVSVIPSIHPSSIKYRFGQRL